MSRVIYNVVFEEEAIKLLLIWFYEDMKDSEAFKELWFGKLSNYMYTFRRNQSSSYLFSIEW